MSVQMGTEKRRATVRNSKKEKLAAPPGFVSLTSFKLKRVSNNEKTHKSVALLNEHESELVPMDTMLEESLRHRPWILFDQAIRGPEQSDCDQVETVTARLPAEETCSTVLEEAPVFYPTKEEFEDTLKFIASIRTQAEPYGICRIFPPLSWQPPCPLMDKNTRETSKFTAHTQKIKEFQSLNLKRKVEEEHEKINNKKSKTDDDEIAPYTEGFKSEPGAEFTLETFKIYADKVKEQFFLSKGKNTVSEDNLSIPGNHRHCEPSVEKIEGEYRRMTKNPTGEIKVIYGVDLESGILGSGFPLGSKSAETSDHLKYEESGWNLNNTPKLPGSLLAFESSKTSSCLFPRLSLGMCFSSHCWKVEEHHLYSLRYMHFGDPIVWYGIPGRYYVKFKAVMKKYFSDLNVETSDLLHIMVTHLSPSILKSEGIPVYRCVQNPREFILVFPGAYHSGFSCGFNCSEKAQFAPVDWLPHGQNVVELYGQIGKKTLISHDKLLIGAATKLLTAQWEISLIKKCSEDNMRWKALCGKDGMLAKALKSRLKQEALRRKYLCNSSKIQKMEADFNTTTKRECSICFYDLHLSASCCSCSPDRYTCLQHTKLLCSCPWSSRFFLFRYTIGELNVLLEAVEGKLSAVYRWAKVHLGLSVSAYTSIDT